MTSAYIYAINMYQSFIKYCQKKSNNTHNGSWQRYDIRRSPNGHKSNRKDERDTKANIYHYSTWLHIDTVCQSQWPVLETTNYIDIMTGVLELRVPHPECPPCMLIAHKDYNTIQVYSVIIMTHWRPDNLARGHLSLLHPIIRILDILSHTFWALNIMS